MSESSKYHENDYEIMPHRFLPGISFPTLYLELKAGRKTAITQMRHECVGLAVLPFEKSLIRGLVGAVLLAELLGGLAVSPLKRT